ncbi:gas vesicle protein GvpG [Streptomyces sp. SBT349]|uniref:gas vesicle protein GvpG n=1 Tax=Streptomyces sp. SBT349 TaxID=1580539 RepID=UPI00066CFACC|nr:gas vesicle protein GvpG [Streptomyces sp. SBT349]
MGLISGLLLLPLAPARGVGWVANRIAEAAEQEYWAPGPLKAQLAALHRAYEDGEIGEEEFECQEEILLIRLHHVLREDRRLDHGGH